MADLENIKKEVESYQNQSVFNRLSSKQFNQIIESMNLYLNKLSEKEAELDRRQVELNEKQDKLNKEVSNFNQEKKEVAESKRQALETIRIFKEKEPTLRDTSIPDEAIARDKIIINELDDIKEQVKILKEREQEIIDNTNYNVKLTIYEMDEREERTSKRRKQKNILKARLLGIVAAYRDLLPEDQLNYLTVNDKSFPSFLKEEMDKIISETPEHEKHWNRRNKNTDDYLDLVSKNIYNALAHGYLSIAKNEVVNSDAAPIYGNISPFAYDAESTNPSSAGFNVIVNICQGRERTLDLTEKNANLTRSIEKMSDKPLVEQSIIDTVNEFDYPFYDVKNSNKSL